jgi:hypothetical protein
MSWTTRWRREDGPRIQGSRPLDSSKLQAPCIVRIPGGGYRLFYTAVGPAKPYPVCQGYVLSAVSADGIDFEVEPGIRLAPHPDLPKLSRRIIAPTVKQCEDGTWRMYFEARGPAAEPTVIRSAVSTDMVNWEHEEGIRLQGFDGLGGPRYLPLPGGRGRLYCFGSEFDSTGLRDGSRLSQSIVSALTSDGLTFEMEPGYRMRDKQAGYDDIGITAAEVIPPVSDGDDWSMVFSAWQDAPPGTVVPVHPANDTSASADSSSEDFATASIASDIAGFRSRIYLAHSADGLNWSRAGCIIDGAGYESDEIDGIHAEDMSVTEIGDGGYRMYYAACGRDGNWLIASAVTEGEPG